MNGKWLVMIGMVAMTCALLAGCGGGGSSSGGGGGGGGGGVTTGTVTGTAK
ncbi:hypothetical protein [Geobacter grbiciae]|uniref:hypothetical protein n=1 Tax=Geobacter grbiciae TaxID=155042 RepID=UPI001C028621|nr:hypothetical protein [Geobacter grbiciae]MBT1076220.1 hypothetical protein [Geobacter grbiciae]